MHHKKQRLLYDSSNNRMLSSARPGWLTGSVRFHFHHTPAVLAYRFESISISQLSPSDERRRAMRTENGVM